MILSCRENLHWKHYSKKTLVKKFQMTCSFKEYVKIVQLYMMNFNVTIFNRLKQWDFLNK